MVKNFVKSLEYLPELPQIGQLCSHLIAPGSSVASCSLTKASGTTGDAETIVASSLKLACLYSLTHVVQSIEDKLVEEQVSAKIITDTLTFVSKSSESGENVVDTLNKSMEIAKSTAPKGFQIIGDNLDLHINVRHMDCHNKNKSLYTVNLVAGEDVVSGEHLPDVRGRTLDAAQVHEFLPSLDEVEKLKRDLIPLWTHVVVK